MQLPIDPLRDPITSAWVGILALVAIVVAVIPLLRTALAGGLWVVGRVTGRHAWRQAAVRVMPRTLHLMGSLLLGVTAMAAPAAAGETPPPVTHLDLDRAATPTPALTAAPTATSDPTPAAASAPQASAEGPRANSEGAPSLGQLNLDRGPLAALDLSEAPSVPATHAAASTQVHLVRTGDTLWDIAESLLPEAEDAELTAAWRAIWAANRSVIGDDPGHIHAGQRLDVGVVAR